MGKQLYEVSGREEDDAPTFICGASDIRSSVLDLLRKCPEVTVKKRAEDARWDK